MVNISPDVAEAITASAPVKPKKKISIWAKVFALVVIVSMTGWVFAAYFENPDSQNTKKNPGLIEISGYSFYDLQDGTYGTFIGSGVNQIPIAFRLDPRNATNIPIDNLSASQLLNAKKVYVTVNPNNQTQIAKIAVAAAEVSRILPLYNIAVVGAYTEDSVPSNPDVPLRTCADAFGTTRVVYLNIGSETSIKTVDKCVYVTGINADELILAADKLGYHLVGILI
jgi:hypothetical protein